MVIRLRMKSLLFDILEIHELNSWKISQIQHQNIPTWALNSYLETRCLLNRNQSHPKKLGMHQRTPGPFFILFMSQHLPQELLLLGLGRGQAVAAREGQTFQKWWFWRKEEITREISLVDAAPAAQFCEILFDRHY